MYSSDRILEKLHTTPLGTDRVRKNLGLTQDTDVIDWVKLQLAQVSASAWARSGKNFYVSKDDFVLVINAGSATLITAHKSR